MDFRLDSYPNFYASIDVIHIFLLSFVEQETNIRANNITYWLNILFSYSQILGHTYVVESLFNVGIYKTNFCFGTFIFHCTSFFLVCYIFSYLFCVFSLIFLRCLRSWSFGYCVNTLIINMILLLLLLLLLKDEVTL